MAASIIPFKMPEPMEIPAHLISQLKEMAPDDAVKQGMELLMGIDAAETMLYEKIGEGGVLELGGAVGNGGDELLAALEGEACYGNAPGEGNSLGGKALEDGTALLVMGNAESGETGIPGGLLKFLVGEGMAGNMGFLYVLPLAGEGGEPLGALTLIRPATAGPLNHEQPNLAEGMRRLLSEVLDG